MDSFPNILVTLFASKADDERSPASSTPVEEDTNGNGQNSYCIIA
jgi:hypothetical protein